MNVFHALNENKQWDLHYVVFNLRYGIKTAFVLQISEALYEYM